MKITSSKRRKHLSLCIQNSEMTDYIQCEIIPRCRYRRQTLKVFVIKIFVLLGPQRPTMPFLTYAYFHYSDIKQTEKSCCCCCSLSSSLSSAFLTGCENNSPREYPFPMSPWGRRPEDKLWSVLRGVVGDCRATYLNMNGIDKCRQDCIEVNWPIWDFSKEI